MSFEIKIGRRILKVPREVEAEGGAAVQRWLDAQLKPKAKKRPRRKSVAPTKTPSTETPS